MTDLTEDEIKDCMGEAATASVIADEHRRKGHGSGIKARYHRGAAHRWDAEAARLTNLAGSSERQGEDQ